MLEAEGGGSLFEASLVYTASQLYSEGYIVLKKEKNVWCVCVCVCPQLISPWTNVPCIFLIDD